MDPQYGDSRPLDAIDQPWIMNCYATPTKNDPWVPPGVIQTAVPGTQPGHYVNSPGHFLQQPGFLNYRNTNSPSDCATLPGDSGYGSSRGQAYSIASASVHGGDDPGLDSHMGQAMNDCHINTEAVPFETPTHHPMPSNRYHCQDCNAWLRSQGELKKHRQRHLKSHKCPYDGCIKGQRGFSTSNDLVRHKRSVHGEHGLPGRSFVCPHCTPGSKGPKIWPRADNFRSHLLRTHHVKLKSDEDHQKFLYQPQALRNDLDGVGTSVGFVDPETRPLCLQESPVLSGQPSTMDSQFQESQLAESQEPLAAQVGIDPAVIQRSPGAFRQRESTVTPGPGENARYIHPLVLSGPLGGDSVAMADTTEAYELEHQLEYAADARSYSQEQVPDACADADADAEARRCMPTCTPCDTNLAAEPVTNVSRESWKPDLSGSSESTRQGLDDLNADMADSQQCRRELGDSETLDLMSIAPGMNSNPSVVVNYLKKFPKRLLQDALKGDGQVTEADSPSDDESSSRAPIECPKSYCDKVFNRPCELKKHMKRHQKPYGCTFKSCCKRFGSKNDWKRHESSQHFMLETWDCDAPGCNKICQRRESFRSHLQKDHNMYDPDKIDEKLEERRLGRHCDPRFWCGFCVRVVQIDVNEEGANSWTKRCDHIDNHLFGKEGLEEKSIAEWRHQEDQQAEQQGQATTETAGDASVSGEPSTVGVEGMERKRRSSTDSDGRPRKKASKMRTYMWTCCMCSTTINLRTSSCCFECSHARCLANCTVEYISPQENEEESEGEGLARCQEGMDTTGGAPSTT